MGRANYTWKDEAAALAIELAGSVVDRLSLQAMEAYKSVPRRGLEVGGLLLGERLVRERQTIRIEDSVEVPSEHRSGPSYMLSESDRQKLHEAVLAHPEAVGMYRTDTHSEALSLQQDDNALFEQHFRATGIFLLIHPASRRAAFCLPAPGGGLRIAHEFGFPTAEFSARQAKPEPPRESGLQVTTQTPEVLAPEPGTPDETRSRTRAKRKSAWLAPIAAILFGAVLGALLWRWHEPAPAPPVTSTSDLAPTRPENNSEHVKLDVQRDGRTLRLLWDRNAAAVRSATHAILHITDGDHQTTLNLSSNELEAGALAYWPDTPNVTFRLEVFSASAKTDDSILAVTGPAGGAPADVNPTAQVGPVAPPRERELAEGRRWSRAKGNQRMSETASRVASEEERSGPAEPDTHSRPAPTPVMANKEPAGTEAMKAEASNTDAAPPSRSPEPRVEISAEPAPPSKLSRMVSHIPLIRRFKKPQEAAVPAEPVHKAQPAIPAADRQELTAEVPIDVRVYVTEGGKVEFAELVDSRSGTRHADLADAALVAARRWNFKPARVGEENVSSEVILHFRFKPAE